MVLPNVDLENTWKIFQPFLFAFLGICSHYAVCKETFIVNLLKMFYLLFSQFLKYAFYKCMKSLLALNQGHPTTGYLFREASIA